MLSSAVLAVSLFCFSNGANAQKTERLLSGKDLLNWNFIVDESPVPADQVYSVRDDKILITGQFSGYVYTKEKYSGCKLHVEWRWPNGDSNANSGTFLHIVDLKSPFPNGIEHNLQAGRAGSFVLLGGSNLVEYQQRPEGERPFLPVVKNMNSSSGKPAGEWNEVSIFMKDGVTAVHINGIYRNTGANKVKEGHIRLQSKGKKVEFRNVTPTKW